MKKKKRQSDVLNSILANQTTLVSALTTSQNSYGSALKENAIYMESIAAKQELFNKAVNDMWTNTINSTTIKNLVDLGTTLVKLADDIGLANIAIVALITYLTVFKGQAILGGTINGISSLITTFKLLKLDIQETGSVVKTFNNLIKGTSVASGIATAGLTILIGALVLGITKLIEYQKELEETYDDLQSASNEYAQNILNQKDEIDKLLTSLDNVNEGTQSYIDSQNTLGEILPQIVEYIDDEGNKHLTTRDAIDKHIESLESLSELYNTAIKVDFTEELILLDNLKTQYEALSYEIYKYQDQIAQERGLELFGGIKQIISPEDYLIELSPELKFQEEYLDYQAQLIQNQIKESLVSQVTFGMDTSDPITQSIQSALVTAFEDVEITDANLTQIGGQMLMFTQRITDLIEKGFDESDYRFISKDLSETYGVSLTDVDKILQSLTKTTEDAIEVQKDLAKTFSELTDEYNFATNNLSNLSKLTDEVSDSNNNLNDIMQYVVSNYSDLEQAGIDVQAVLKGEIGLTEALQQATKDQYSAQLQSRLAMLETEEDYFNTDSKLWSQFYGIVSEYYGQDYQNWVELAEAKGITETQLIKFLSGEWGAYYKQTIANLETALAHARSAEAVKALREQIQALKESSEFFNDFSPALLDLSTNLDDVTSSTKSATEATETFADKLKEVLAIQKDALEDNIDALEKEQDLLEEGYDTQLDLLDQQLDALKDQWEQEDAIAELEEKRLAVAKALEKLANTEREKTVLLYTGEGELSGWEWVTDPRLLKEAKDELANTEKTLQEALLQERRDAEERFLEEKIDLLEAEKDAQVKFIQDQIDALDAQKDIIDEFVDDMGLLNDEVLKNVNSWEELVSAMGQAGISYDAITGGAGLVSPTTGGGSETGEAGVGKVSTISGTLKRGSKGDDVKLLQSALNAFGYKAGTVDGIFGSITDSAVRAFQSANGVAVDGIVGANTKSKFAAKGYRDGGSVDYTGIAAVHGSKSSPEWMLPADVTRLVTDNAMATNKFVSMMGSGNVPLVNNNQTTNDSSGGLTINKLIVQSNANNLNQLVSEISNLAILQNNRKVVI